MRLPMTLVLLLSMLSLPVYAETWFCVGERIAWVTDKDGKVTESKAGLNNSKYLVDEKGVREMGEDSAFLDSCIWNEDRPAACERSGMVYGGHFRMNNKNIFTLLLIIGTEDGETSDTVIKGKCSKI